MATLQVRAGRRRAWVERADGSAVDVDWTPTLDGYGARVDVQNVGIAAFEGDADAQVAWINMARNELDGFVNATLPSSLTTLDLSDNHIERFELVRLPSSLRTLDLSGNPLAHVEIRASDAGVFSGLQVSPSIQMRQTQCLDPSAAIQRIQQHSVCVVSDARFDEKRSVHQGEAATSVAVLTASTASGHASSSSSSSSIPSDAGLSMIVGGCMLAVIVVFAVWLWWRRQRLRQQQFAFDRTYRGSITAHSEYVDALTPDTVAMMAQTSGYRRKSFSDVPQCATSMELFRRLASTACSDSGATAPDTPVSNTSSSLLESPMLEAFRVAPDSIKEGELMHQGQFTQADSVKDFMGDIALGSMLQHANIVALLGFYNWSLLATGDSRSSPVAVSEFMPCGDLASLLKRTASGPNTLKWLKQTAFPRSKADIALDVMDALVYLHSRTPSILPQSLKAQKVLLTDDYTAKLCSLGVNRTVGRKAQRDAHANASVAWLAPEILRGEAASELSDVYSFGVLLTELDTGAAPFADALDCDNPGVSRQDQLAMLISSGSIRPALSMRCPESVQRLVVRCLRFHPLDRPSAAEVQHILRELTGRTSSVSVGSPRPKTSGSKAEAPAPRAGSSRARDASRP